MTKTSLAVTLALASLIAPLAAQDRTPILFDTDIGSDVDDAFALALILASPELELRGVTTVSGNTADRAILACRFLAQTGQRDIPVAAGAEPQPKQDLSGQNQYRNHPAAIYGRAGKPVSEPAAEFLYQKLKAEPGQLTLCAVGPLTNVARLLADHPDSKTLLKRIVIMGGSLPSDQPNKKPAEAEWNLRLDPVAARAVLASGVPLVIAPLQATDHLKVSDDRLQKLFAPCSLLTLNLQALYQQWDQPTPTLYDPVAVALCSSEKYSTLQDLCLQVDDSGVLLPAAGKPNLRAAVATDKEPFLDFALSRIAGAMSPALPKPPGNPSQMVERGQMPNRVHAFEDFETDIERRWWMSGKAETKNIPPGSTRACRAILTQDFDDKQGALQTLYQAVIFNPVPGPPMGKSPRLSFRYFLRGTDTLRVQIYSLTNGYHRYLSLTGLPQGRWEHGCVDMKHVRRPDGTGGPLSADERIDDIQFYVDPRAELLIDDIVLYDASAEGETRPFPAQLHFTGWFDTGKQGKEWPGQFEIVAKPAPETWKAARSLVDPKGGAPKLEIDLRGERPLGKALTLFLRYRIQGGESLGVRLAGETGATWRGTVAQAKADGWREAMVPLSREPAGGAATSARRLVFEIPPGAELWVDDLLLYEPGGAKAK